jgi:hypothetical protein
VRLQQWEGADFIGQNFQDVVRLGAPFKIIDDATPFRVEVADRARIRTQVAREFFVAEHGRAPIDARELAGQIVPAER